MEKEKKEIGKLIELLNEYNCDVLGLADHREYKDYMGGIRLTSVGCWKIYLYVISKGYGFIKRLVENDKIEKGSLFYNTGDLPDDDVSKLLMLLAISDTPIEDLISYLK